MYWSDIRRILDTFPFMGPFALLYSLSGKLQIAGDFVFLTATAHRLVFVVGAREKGSAASDTYN